jgi:hypothetical protein
MATENSNTLTYHNHKKHPLHRLPFVGGRGSDGGISFWRVPAKGGYVGGNETGDAAALMFLKYLRANGATPTGALQHIVLDMLPCHTDAALRGQVVGFFATLEPWLAEAARAFGAELDTLTEHTLVKRANAGLALDKEGERALIERRLSPRLD